MGKMKLKKKRGRRSQLADINVVPYIDVMLVLLVIFMVTTPLLSQGVHVDLPQASSKPIAPQKEEPIIVSIDAQGLYYLNSSPTPDQAIDATALTAQVSSVVQAAEAKK